MIIIFQEFDDEQDEDEGDDDQDMDQGSDDDSDDDSQRDPNERRFGEPKPGMVPDSKFGQNCSTLGIRIPDIQIPFNLCLPFFLPVLF